MKLCWRFTAAVLFGAFALRAEVPEILKVVPEARGYELIARLNPLEWGSRGYLEDRSGQISGELKRVAYLLKLSGKDGKVQWVFVAMDPFAEELGSVLVPTENSPGYQTYVRNLEVASNVDGVKTGRFEQGNIEFCGKNYGGYNAKRIPGATHDFDFGDSFSEDGGYGCMQLHNYLEKQTIFAFNNLKRNANCDLGIGNSPQGKSDWTFSGAGRQYQTAELLIAGKFDGFQLRSAGTDHVESACIAVGVHHFTGNFNSLIVDNAGWASEKSEKFTVGVCGFDSVEKSRNDVVSAGCLSAGEDDADVAHGGRVGIVP